MEKLNSGFEGDIDPRFKPIGGDAYNYMVEKGEDPRMINLREIDNAVREVVMERKIEQGTSPELNALNLNLLERGKNLLIDCMKDPTVALTLNMGSLMTMFIGLQTTMAVSDFGFGSEILCDSGLVLFGAGAIGTAISGASLALHLVKRLAQGGKQ